MIAYDSLYFKNEEHLSSALYHLEHAIWALRQVDYPSGHSRVRVMEWEAEILGQLEAQRNRIKNLSQVVAPTPIGHLEMRARTEAMFALARKEEL
jgi:hypothetical protein